VKRRREAIILAIDEYEELLEDILDLAVVLERWEESTTPFEEVKKRLKEVVSCSIVFASLKPLLQHNQSSVCPAISK